MSLPINKFPGRCNGCKNTVAAEAGYREQIAGRWVVWCKTCVPYQMKAVRKLTLDGKIIIEPYEAQALSLVKAMPGARFVGKDKGGPYWSVSLEEQDRERLLELCNRLKLEIPGELNVVTVTENAEWARARGARDYQVTGINWIAKRKGALLADDMGLGKTLQTLLALEPNAPVIAVVPAAVKYNWEDETKKWRPEFKVSVLEGKLGFRFPEPGEIVVINYEMLPAWLLPKKGEDGKPVKGEDGLYVFDIPQENYEALKNTTLIVDECHRAKKFSTLRSQKLSQLSRMCKRVWGLTGTPLENRQMDLYGVLSSLNLAREVFGSFGRFTRLMGGYKNKWGGWEWGQPDPAVPEMLRRVMLRRMRVDVLPELPTKTYTTMKVEIEDAKLERDMDAMWADIGDELEVEKALPDFQEFSAMRARLAADRIPAMLEYVEECEEQNVPLLVFSAHKAPVEKVAERAGWALITGDTPPKKRQEVVRAFQAGELRGVGITIEAGGVGLTLTRAWRALFVDLAWNPSANAQAEDRICRIGQTSNKVEIIRMVSDHILDQHVLDLLAMKQNIIEKAIEKTVAVSDAKFNTNETDEEFAERMAAIEKAAAEAQAKENAEREAQNAAKVTELHERMKGRANPAKLLELTPERIEAVSAALYYMLERCDGAHEKDGAGFNKPDARLSRYIAALDTKEKVETAYYMLSRYHRQLGSEFPVLFK